MIGNQNINLPTHVPQMRWMGQFDEALKFWGASDSTSFLMPPSKPGESRKVRLSDDLGIGYWEFVEFDPGFGLVVNNANYHATNVVSFEGEDLLKFHFRLQARSALYVEPIGRVDLDGAACQVFYHPRGIIDYEWIELGPVDSWVSIYCTPEYFTDVLGFEERLLPSELAEAVSGRSRAPYLAHLPMTLPIRQICSEVSQCPYEGTVRAKYLEAQAIRLLCETYSRLKSERNRHLIDLCDRDVRAIHDAYAILQENFHNPPSVNDISRAVGVNRNKLLMGFKLLFGMTLQDFSLRRRMELGKRLLAETSEPISRIAEQVGYDHPNNFSCAFKRVYGVSPTTARGK